MKTTANNAHSKASLAAHKWMLAGLLLLSIVTFNGCGSPEAAEEAEHLSQEINLTPESAGSTEVKASNANRTELEEQTQVHTLLSDEEIQPSSACAPSDSAESACLSVENDPRFLGCPWYKKLACAAGIAACVALCKGLPVCVSVCLTEAGKAGCISCL